MLCVSYSGNTEETLACFEAAGVLGAGRIVATTGGALAQAARAESVPVIPMAGGLQPRAAVAYSTVAALEAAALCGAGPKLTTEIDVAADHLEQLAVAWGPEAGEESEAKVARARAARHRPGVRRRRAHAARSPIAGRRRSTRTPSSTRSRARCRSATTTRSSAGPRPRRTAASAPSSSTTATTHPRVAQRIRLTREIIGEAAAGSHVVPTRGQTTVERAFSLVLLGDLVSVYLGVLNGEDPVTIEPIDRLKARLADER